MILALTVQLNNENDKEWTSFSCGNFDDVIDSSVFFANEAECRV
jgi:hypothetical protein